jgi:hypothetical protein
MPTASERLEQVLAVLSGEESSDTERTAYDRAKRVLGDIDDTWIVALARFAEQGAKDVTQKIIEIARDEDVDVQPEEIAQVVLFHTFIMGAQLGKQLGTVEALENDISNIPTMPTKEG